MKLNYKMLCAGVPDEDILRLFNEALRIQDVKEPNPMQVETAVAAVALAAECHAARKGNMLLFWSLEYGDVWPYPEAVEEAIRRGGQEK